MADLVVIVPSRGRPHAVAEMAAAFKQTCTARTRLWFAVDDDDPTLGEYEDAAREGMYVVPSANTSMVDALNRAARYFATGRDGSAPVAIGFMGDDHRPRTLGWDRAYLNALAAKPGIVYSNDLFQGERLPTQCAMSTELVRALGHMAPPVLTHLYVDNYWRDLGYEVGCITYLPDVIVEHLHPIAGKAAVDEGYRRVNSPAMYDHDRNAYAAYVAQHWGRDVAVVRSVLTGVTA